MNELITQLASDRNIFFIFEDVDRIEGYTEAEIEEIEKFHPISVYGQLRILLETMGKCSGDLLIRDVISEDYFMLRDDI